MVESVERGALERLERKVGDAFALGGVAHWFPENQAVALDFFEEYGIAHFLPVHDIALVKHRQSIKAVAQVTESRIAHVRCIHRQVDVRLVALIAARA